jgi:hypothetical protein
VGALISWGSVEGKTRNRVLQYLILSLNERSYPAMSISNLVNMGSKD